MTFGNHAVDDVVFAATKHVHTGVNGATSQWALIICGASTTFCYFLSIKYTPPELQRRPPCFQVDAIAVHEPIAEDAVCILRSALPKVIVHTLLVGAAQMVSRMHMLLQRCLQIADVAGATFRANAIIVEPIFLGPWIV